MHLEITQYFSLMRIYEEYSSFQSGKKAIHAAYKLTLLSTRGVREGAGGSRNHWFA